MPSPEPERRQGRVAVAPSPRASSERHLTILVVDDCPDTTASFALLLEAWGHAAVVANSGPEALEAAGRCQPDIVLLDLRVPGMDGVELARRLRADQGRPLLVAMTADAGEKARRRSAELGCELHLVKPVAPDELQRLLERYVERCDDDA